MKYIHGLNQEFKVRLLLIFFVCFVIQIVNAGTSDPSVNNSKTIQSKFSKKNKPSIIKPMSVGESLIIQGDSTKSGLNTTPLSWVSHTPIPAEWLKPNSKFNELGILKVHDNTYKIHPMKPQEGLLIFKKEAKSLPLGQRIKFIEMGLNSNNPAIFDYALDEIINKKHHPAKNILSKLLQQKSLNENVYRRIYKAHHQLTYETLANNHKAAYLQRIFVKDNPKINQDLFFWAIEEFGNIATLDYFNVLIPLTKIPALKKEIYLTKIKLQLNSKFKDNLDRYIQATLNTEPLIRNWGLANILNTNSKKAARFLLLLYEQTNIDNGLMEFEKIREILEIHQAKFPALYTNLLPNFNENQSF